MDWTDRLIELALEEDLGPGDITTDLLVDAEAPGRAVLVAKESLVVAGTDVVRRVFLRLDPTVRIAIHCADGTAASPGDVLITVDGRMAALLKAERTALNFLQRLSGIATQAREWVRVLAGKPVRLVDTRKTTPGWRVLEKYAVRIGGAANHRMGLYDGVLIKDNHIAACGGVARAVAKARQNAHHLVRIEVEASTMSEVEEALGAGADVILLDNMSVEEIREAVGRINHRALVEISGNVTLERLPSLADLGADFISVGALTHQARAVDISMRLGPEGP